MEATGVVEALDPALAQVVIDHEDIPGVMPAMSMSFDVADPRLFALLAPGQRIAFTLEIRGRSLRVVDARVLEAAGAAGRSGTFDAGGFARAAGEAEPAPDFALVDQDGKPVALADLRGKTLLLDFVYTHCPGPCPILTGRHVAVQRALPPSSPSECASSRSPSTRSAIRPRRCAATRARAAPTSHAGRSSPAKRTSSRTCCSATASARSPARTARSTTSSSPT